jgi:hypothetical protein
MPTAKLRLTVPHGVWIGDLSRSHPAATLRVLAALADGDAGVGLVEVTADDPGGLCEAMRGYDSVTDVEVFSCEGEEALVQFETSAPLLLLPAQGSGIPLELPFDIRDGQAVWEVTAPQDRLAALGRQLEEFGISFDVEWVQQAVEEEELLTGRQRELLQAAVESGYYDTPRRCSLTDLAEEVGIAKSTASETLHRAESKVVKQHLETLASARGDATLVGS